MVVSIGLEQATGQYYGTVKVFAFKMRLILYLHRYPGNKELKFKFLEEDIKETNNNGIEYVAAVLEAVYLRPDFPPQSQQLSQSLKVSGKSR